MEKDIIILGIETSCDETSVAVVKNGREVLSNEIYSQIDIHKQFGGVVPEVASRKHVEKINYIIDIALKEAGCVLDDINAICVTYGPGLVGALLVGVSAAKALAYATDKPLIGINHIEGHISANYVKDKTLEPEFLCLIVSGGHSHLVHVKDYGKYEILGQTRDDAVGEAYDKVARVLGLGYPGGPKIDKLAKEGNKDAIKFTRSFLEEGSDDFSFSGIKSSVINYMNTAKMKNEDVKIEDVAASFQEAVIDVLTTKTINRAISLNIDTVVLAGGVAANSRLREVMSEKCLEVNKKIVYPDIIMCTDNAAMIASAGYYKYLKKEFSDLTLNAIPNLKLK